MASFHCILQLWKVFLFHVYLEVNIKGDYKVSHDLPRAGRLHWNLGRTFSKAQISARSIAVSLNTSLGAWSWVPKGNSAPAQLILDNCWLLSPAWFTITEEPPPSASLAWRDYILKHHFVNLWSFHYILVENPIKKCLSCSFPFSFPELPFTSVSIFSFCNFSGMILSRLL